jgi:hypothetical protein
MLVSAGRSVLLQRVPVLDESILQAALRAAGLSDAAFVELLGRGRVEGLASSAGPHALASDS